jgi:SAM-dependent methyltransferase
LNKFPTILNTLKKIIFFSLRLTWALAVLVVLCVVWVVLFALFLPFILLAVIIAGRSNQVPPGQKPQQVDRKPDDDGSIPLVFDRRQDISKLFGCNTRNVQYRWNLFSLRIEQILKRHEQPNALDFGAGSLRDSYELARLGFCVTSVDLDPAVMDRYFKSYDWAEVHRAPTIFTAPIETLREGDTAFHLAIAFDVIEHLEDPSHYCHRIHSLLREDGLLFTIVPNRRSIFERYFRHSIKKQKAKGIALVPGVPAIQTAFGVGSVVRAVWIPNS